MQLAVKLLKCRLNMVHKTNLTEKYSGSNQIGRYDNPTPKSYCLFTNTTSQRFKRLWFIINANEYNDSSTSCCIQEWRRFKHQTRKYSNTCCAVATCEQVRVIGATTQSELPSFCLPLTVLSSMCLYRPTCFRHGNEDGSGMQKWKAFVPVETGDVAKINRERISILIRNGYSQIYSARFCKTE